MVQATTPTFVLTLPQAVDLSQASSVVFVLSQENTIIEKKDAALTIEGQTVSVYLTQSETLKLHAGSAKLQLNWVYADGSRAATDIKSIRVTENLLKKVIS